MGTRTFQHVLKAMSHPAQLPPFMGGWRGVGMGLLVLMVVLMVG